VQHCTWAQIARWCERPQVVAPVQTLGHRPAVTLFVCCDIDFEAVKEIGGDIVLERSQAIMKGAAFCDFRFKKSEV
jgi:hypothetical protein